jgi:hypothetical protein
MKKSIFTTSFLLLSAIALTSCGPTIEIPEAPKMPSLENASLISIGEATSLYDAAKQAYLSIETFGEKNAPQTIRAKYNEHVFEGTTSDNNYLDSYGMIETNYSAHYLRRDFLSKAGRVSDGKETFTTTNDASELLYEVDGNVTYKNYIKVGNDSPLKETDTFKYEDNTSQFASYYHPNFGELNRFYVQSNSIFNDNFSLENKVTDEYEEVKKYYSRGEGSFIIEQTYTYSADKIHTYLYEYKDNFIAYFSYNKTTGSNYNRFNIAYEYDVTPNIEWTR